MTQESNLAQFIRIVFRWKRFIVIDVVVVMTISTVIAFLLPRWYKSTATILPPKRQDVFSSLGAASSIVRGLTNNSGLRGLGAGTQVYNYFAILNSRTASEAVINKFDLIHVYDIADTSMEKAIKELSYNVSFEEKADDYISIEVYDKDPIRAANMANYYVELLNQISTNLGTTEARNNRVFIEARLTQAKASLAYAEDSLRNYQKKSGMMLSPEQTETISSIAMLYGMKAKKEVELAIIQKTLGLDNPTVSQAKLELNELEKKLSTFPELGLESFRLYRNVIIQEKIVEFLLPLYEQARIDEQKDVPVVLLLDKAVPAERESKPRKLLIIAISNLLNIVLIIFSIVTSIFLKNYFGRNKEVAEQLKQLLQWRKIDV